MATPPEGPVADARPRLHWPIALAVVGAAALVIVLLLAFPRETEPAPGTLAVAALSDLRSRGRTAPRQPPLPPAALASPEPTPSAAPAPSVAVAAPRVTAGPVGPAGGGGAGTARPVPTVTPRPAPVATVPPRTPLPALRASVTRFRGRVLDVTGQPLAEVCVVNGVVTCTVREPYTDAAGYWVLDVPNDATWDLHFVLAGYSVGYRRVDSTGGEVRVPDITLRSTR